MSERVPQLWEVWHARFDFSEGRGYKYRPVLPSEPSAAIFAMVALASSSGKTASMDASVLRPPQTPSSCLSG